MLTINCPSCGAPVNFRSKASVFAVCSFCKSTLVRNDMNLEALGKMSELQDDMSPLQIGVTGKYEGDSFELVGRLNVGYDDGSWNEWYALFSDSREAWLAEAQGFYAMCFPLNAEGLPSPGTLRPGLQLTLGKEGTFEIADMRKVHCRFSEGELPLQAGMGRKSLSIDLAGADNQMATIEYTADESASHESLGQRSARVFIGEYVEFDSFTFKNLRRFDGW